MKRLLIILFFLPVLFACSKEELFEEGQEIVLNMSVDMGDLQSAATRAMGDNVSGTPALWLVVFDSEGYLVEWTKASEMTSADGVTNFKATLHATLEGRIMHFLLNYVDDDVDLHFDYGHENNIIGGLTVERDRDVYWQRVELPEGINGSTEATGTTAKYLTKVPLVRNFSKITVTENLNDFELLGFYVLNVPNRGTVAPFMNGSFIKYYNETSTFNGASFTPKTYATLNSAGYTGAMPDNDERINKHTVFTESTTLLAPTASYYLYESTYINGNKDKTVSVLLRGKYNNNEYWYRVDLVKANEGTGVIEYFDILRNFAYNINITQVTAGKTSAKDAIEQPAGNNILSSLDIAHLTNVSDGKATLEVNYTDTVLISNDAVTVRYKFTDTGTGTKNTNENIKNKTSECGWYLTYDGATAPISVDIATADTDGWRNVTISVTDEKIAERKEVSITFFATSTTKQVLSRTVHYTLLPKQTMLVECPLKVDAIVGTSVNVNILIPDGLPEAMFPLDFAIEAQAYGNTSYLAQYITPANTEEISVQTGGSIVDIENLKGKKSFQYVISLSYAEYLTLTKESRTLSNGQNVQMRILATPFKTNTAQSASTVYAYNRYFYLGSDYFLNDYFMATFSNDETENYGVGRTVTLDITAGQAGSYSVEINNADVVTTQNVATRAISNSYTLAAGEIKSVKLTASTFAEQVSVIVTCDGVSKTVTAAVRNNLKPKVTSAKYGNDDVSSTQELGIYKTQSDAQNRTNAVGTTTVSGLKSGANSYTIAGLTESSTSLVYFSYTSGNYVYVASATASALSAGTAALSFTRTEIKANITNITLSGQGKKSGKNCTLQFETDQLGTYTITVTEGDNTTTITKEVEIIGEITMDKFYETKTDKSEITITIKGVNATETKTFKRS